jgi:formylglycine-generating enzyme required for sulfatase activity
MGSEGHYACERPRHRVFVDAFRVSPTAVTRREYGSFLTATGHIEPRGWNEPEFQLPDQPIVGVSWFDAVAYCAWLTHSTGEAHRLPTEAEWERACRGGREDAQYAWGDEPPDSLPYFRGSWTGPRRVAEWQPNALGLFNFGDNVHEWCSDWYSPTYYAESPQSDPKGPDTGTRRSSRGGSWRHQVKGTRAAHRSSLPPECRYTDYGFRVFQSPGRGAHQGAVGR